MSVSEAGRISLRGLKIRLGAGSQAFDAVRDVDLDIEPGSFVCLLGPSGCGKSTLLGALAGHLSPAAGQILLDGAPVAGPHPERGLVFQQHTLFPWLSLVDNVAFGPKMRRVGRSERRQQALAALRLVGLGEFADFYPAQLSGGMQQRAEIARVLINQPRVLLMDEPFGALDPVTRDTLGADYRMLHARLGLTTVMVTHDMSEAVLLADRVVVLVGGQVVGDGAPGALLKETRDPDVRALLEAPRRQAERLRAALDGAGA